jgi:hypothetical protein
MAGLTSISVYITKHINELNVKTTNRQNLTTQLYDNTKAF